MLSFKVAKLTKAEMGYNNFVMCNPNDFSKGEHLLFKDQNVIYPFVTDPSIQRGTIGMSNIIRPHYNLAYGDNVNVKSVTIAEKRPVKSMKVICKLMGEVNTVKHEDELKESIKNAFKNYYLCPNQILLFKITDNDKKQQQFNMVIDQIEGGCYVVDKTIIEIISNDTKLNIIGSHLLKRDLFRDDYNFEEIGIGGLSEELKRAFRNALSTRAYNSSVAKKLGIKHVKGILLYGPPGCGKTLIARKIGGLISNIPPKLVNGPEILNKFVGQSEENIRNLFAEAIRDEKTNGDDSGLHVIIFDEIDAICKARGRSNSASGINDTVVNQLLSMIQGVNELNNIFIIAMTNRKDLLDEALLRPGRIEVHIEIGLADKKGREQILRIHTDKMKINNMMDRHVDIEHLAEITENYSGAEIEGIVKNAASRALQEQLSSENPNISAKDIIVTMKHFIEAANEIQPAFGNTNQKLSVNLPETYYELSPEHAICYREINEFILKNRRLKTVIIFGEPGTGKTTLLSKIATDNKIKFTKFVKAFDIATYDEYSKSIYIHDLINNAYVSEKSLVAIDDIEIVINYSKIGNVIKFSDRLYLLLLAILKNSPTPNHELTFIVTCGDYDLYNQIRGEFDYNYEIGEVDHECLKIMGYDPNEYYNITVKKLLNR